MNLGDIFLKTFLVLLLLPTMATFVVLSPIRRRLDLTWGALTAIAIVIAPIAGVLLNYPLHRPAFIAWHKMQNQFVPQTGCLTYSPDFARLYVKYQMTLPQFISWTDAHPWGLKPGSNSLLFHDSEAMGFDNLQSSFATDMADEQSDRDMGRISPEVSV